MAQLLVRVDDDVKKDADKLFGEIGMTTQTAVNVFLREARRVHGFPFALNVDPFYSESNMKVLRESVSQMNDSNYPKIIKTMDELVAMGSE